MLHSFSYLHASKTPTIGVLGHRLSLIADEKMYYLDLNFVGFWFFFSGTSRPRFHEYYGDPDWRDDYWLHFLPNRSGARLLSQSKSSLQQRTRPRA